MGDRRQPAEIIAGLPTTSAKIRALADAGYDRAEIARLLSIRYQHVRNVLVGPGSTEQRAPQIEVSLEPITIDASPAPREDILYGVLVEGGFQFVGEWSLESDGSIKLEAKASLDSGVYAFVADDVVVYVGLTNSGFRTTFDQYRRGDERQRTRARVKKLIAEVLAKGQCVKVFVATPDPLEWRGLPVLTAAGLEAGLIRMIRPVWNITGAA